MAETSPRFREIIRRLGIDWRATNKCAIDFKDPNLAPSTDLWGKRKRLPMNEHERYSEMCYYGPENKYFEINVKCYCDAHYFHLVTISKLIDTNSEFMDFFSVLDEASIESKYSLFCKIARKLAHCGECGYLHTDLKPENIMIDEDEMPHLVDWEFNRRRGWEQLCRGTPQYVFVAALCGEDGNREPWYTFYKNPYREDWWALMGIAYIAAEHDFLYDFKKFDWVSLDPAVFAEYIDARFEKAKQDARFEKAKQDAETAKAKPYISEEKQKSFSLQIALLNYGQRLHEMMQTNAEPADLLNLFSSN